MRADANRAANCVLAASDHGVKDLLCVERMGRFFAPAEHQQILVLLYGKRLFGDPPLPPEQGGA